MSRQSGIYVLELGRVKALRHKLGLENDIAENLIVCSLSRTWDIHNWQKQYQLKHGCTIAPQLVLFEPVHPNHLGLAEVAAFRAASHFGTRMGPDPDLMLFSDQGLARTVEEATHICHTWSYRQHG